MKHYLSSLVFTVTQYVFLQNIGTGLIIPYNSDFTSNKQQYPGPTKFYFLQCSIYNLQLNTNNIHVIHHVHVKK